MNSLLQSPLSATTPVRSCSRRIQPSSPSFRSIASWQGEMTTAESLEGPRSFGASVLAHGRRESSSDPGSTGEPRSSHDRAQVLLDASFSCGICSRYMLSYIGSVWKCKANGVSFTFSSLVRSGLAAATVSAIRCPAVSQSFAMEFEESCQAFLGFGQTADGHSAHADGNRPGERESRPRFLRCSDIA